MFKKHLCIILILVLILLFPGCGSDNNKINTQTFQEPTITASKAPTPTPSTNENRNSEVTEPPTTTPQSEPSATPEPSITSDAPLEVHFIDVGQADSILIKAPDGKSMLIDAGNNADGPEVVSYLKKQGINKIDVLVGTHPHEDHIGGLDNVINSFDIGQIYMPKVSHTTKTFEDVLIAIQNKGLKVTTPVPGSTFDLGTAKCTILAPNNSSYEGLNNYSIVVKLEYGNTSFLFTGDAESVSEQEMLSKGYDLKTDVLKVGHHGSDSSTTQAFLDKINPAYAVIMVGKENSYGHPSKAVMDRLQAKGVAVYRTDENGTIVATSNGNSIMFNVKSGSYAARVETLNSPAPETKSEQNSETEPTPPTTDRIVYWTPSGKSYHYSKNCPTLSRSKTILEGPLSECPKTDPCDKCVKW